MGKEEGRYGAIVIVYKSTQDVTSTKPVSSLHCVILE